MKSCSKCLSSEILIKHDAVMDMMSNECKTCGYKWRDFPADGMWRAEKEIKDAYNRLPPDIKR